MVWCAVKVSEKSVSLIVVDATPKAINVVRRDCVDRVYVSALSDTPLLESGITKLGSQ